MQGLDDLVSQAECIATNLEDDEIPHIHRNIEQLRKRGETFYNRAAQNDIKAAKLLGNKVSYELSVGLSKTLETLNVMSSPDNLLTNIEDIPSFLKNERETAILSSINLTRNHTQNVSYIMCEAAKSEWWKKEKINILSMLLNSDKLPLGITPEIPKSRINNSVGENNRFIKTTLSREEQQYARELSIYIEDRLMENQSEFRDRKLLRCITNINNNVELSEISRLVERYCVVQSQNESEYHGQISPEIRHGNSSLSKDLVNAALSHLENDYFLYISSHTNALQNNNKMGIIATFVSTQLAPQFVGTIFEDQSVMGGVPVWPMIFACLRAGLHNEALTAAKNASSNLGDFHIVLDTWITKGILLPEQNRKLTAEYKRHVRDSGDSYKKLVYSLLSGCDGDDAHSSVINNIDDFMWLQLAQLRRVSVSQNFENPTRSNNQLSYGIAEQSGSQTNSLFMLQKLITEQYGEQYFHANQQPFTYCRILLLCQLFEPALAFLARFDHLRCHAVHLALVLCQNNLLLISNYDAPLLNRCEDDLEGLNQLNLMRLLTLYTSKFESSHPKYALDLFYMLSDLHCDNDDTNGFVMCASSLAVETGQLEQLFGRFDNQGNNHPGILARYGSVADSILDGVAKRLKQIGRTEEACDALQLAGRFEEAAVELSEILASTLSLPGKHPNVTRLESKAELLLWQMDCNNESELLKCIATVAKFIWLSNDDDVEAALSVLDKTHLLPKSLDPNAVRSAVESFKTQPELVRSLFPGLLVAAMKTLRSATHCCQNSHDFLVDIRRRAEALITFTGQLPYRMPSEVYASLSQLEIEIR